MRELVEYIAKSIASKPEEVKVTETEGRRAHYLQAGSSGGR